jgi:hypothetical protein
LPNKSGGEKNTAGVLIGDHVGMFRSLHRKRFPEITGRGNCSLRMFLSAGRFWALQKKRFSKTGGKECGSHAAQGTEEFKVAAGETPKQQNTAEDRVGQLGSDQPAVVLLEDPLKDRTNHVAKQLFNSKMKGKG